MNIVILTAAEPLYLPAIIARLLKDRAGSVRGIFLAPPRYGKDSSLRMIRKYVGAFGLVNALRLACRVAGAKLGNALGLGGGRRYYSIPSAAAAFGVPCAAVPDVNGETFLRRLREMETDLIVSVSCPQVFRKALIELPPRGCLNLHGARLPQYRGIAPSFWMMARGETKAGVTVFFVNEDIDSGDVVEREEFDILPDESLHQFIIRSKRIAGQALLRAIQKIQDGNVETTPLDRKAGSYFGFPTRQAYREFRRRGRKLW